MADWDTFLKGMQVAGQGFGAMADPYFRQQDLASQIQAQKERDAAQQNFQMQMLMAKLDWDREKFGLRGGRGRGGGGGSGLGSLFQAPSTQPTGQPGQPQDINRYLTNSMQLDLGGMSTEALGNQQQFLKESKAALGYGPQSSMDPEVAKKLGFIFNNVQKLQATQTPQGGAFPLPPITISVPDTSYDKRTMSKIKLNPQSRRQLQTELNTPIPGGVYKAPTPITPSGNNALVDLLIKANQQIYGTVPGYNAPGGTIPKTSSTPQTKAKKNAVTTSYGTFKIEK